MADKTPDEILEEQRAERTKEYAEKINDLHLKEAEAKDKINNLEQTLADAFAKRKEELDSLEDDARKRIAELDNKSADASVLRKEAEAKLKEADDILAKAKVDRDSHQDNLDNHLNSVNEIKISLASKSSELGEREERAFVLEAEAKTKMEEAVNKEKEIEEQANKLVHISSNVNDDIAKQKEIQEQTENKIKELNLLTQTLATMNAKNADDLAGLIVIRDSLDAERKSQVNRKLEMSDKEEDLRQKGVKYALDMQRLQDKQKDIDAQVGKLNELKNNVESLMKLQEKEK